MRDPGRAGVQRRTHRRELLPVGGPKNGSRPGLHRNTRWPHW